MVSRPAGPRKTSGLGGVTGGGNYGGAPSTLTPAQVDPTPLKPSYPIISMAKLADDPLTRKLWKAPWMVQPPTSAPGSTASESGGKRKKKMTESLIAFLHERKKRTEGGWPGEKPYSGAQKGLDAPQEQPKPQAEPSGPEDWFQGKGNKKDAIEWLNKNVSPTLQGMRARYPTNKPHSPPQIGGGTTMGSYRESTLINAVLQLQEMGGGNLFEKAKKKVIQELLVPSCEGVGYSKDAIQPSSVRRSPTEIGIGQTASLTYESGGKKKRTEGGLGGHLSQMGSGEPGETKNYGPRPSGGNLNKILGGSGGGEKPLASTSDSNLGGDAGGTAGAAAGAVAGAAGEAGGAAGAAGAATGSSGKEGSTSPVSSGIDKSSATVQGGPSEVPKASFSRTEGGKKRK